ncbi:MAG: transcriptional repressor [Lachnospiraceae bacterium]|nr:transcriptional repressor [Lachnospiraceae bacterium]
MNTKSKYKTKQREVLIDYLENIPEAHFTASDVCEYCKSKGTPIGQSTVYRQLERMVDEGVVNKYIIDEKSPACFEYVADGTHISGENCFHCKCEKCGKLIHLHCDELVGIAAHLEEHHGFTLNPMRTVFYGICEECREL